MRTEEPIQQATAGNDDLRVDVYAAGTTRDVGYDVSYTINSVSEREQEKVAKYKALLALRQAAFRPVVVDYAGAVGKSTGVFLTSLASRLRRSDHPGSPRSPKLHLSFMLQWCQAVAFVRAARKARAHPCNS